jgi:heptosyltransferase-2
MRILIIKIGAIGDVIMSLPVITEIKAQYPDSHIAWICGKLVQPILLEVPLINEVIPIDENNLFHKNKLKPIKELIAIYSRIGFKKFDLILNFHSDYRYKLIGFFLRSSTKLYLSRNNDRPVLIPGRSRAFEHVRLFLRSDNNFAGNIYFPSDTVDVSKLRPEISISLNNEGRYAIIAPGGAKNILNEQALRRWPIENYVELSISLLNSGFNVILTGAQSDKWIDTYFAHLKIINLIGQLSLIELIALMKRVDLVITHDSGPFHLAVFAQKPYVIGLFGPTNPREFAYSNNYSKVKTIWGGAHLLCSPCYYGKYFSTECKNNICMQRITPDSVMEIVSKLAVGKNAITSSQIGLS